MTIFVLIYRNWFVLFYLVYHCVLNFIAFFSFCITQHLCLFLVPFLHHTHTYCWPKIEVSLNHIKPHNQKKNVILNLILNPLEELPYCVLSFSFIVSIPLRTKYEPSHREVHEIQTLNFSVYYPKCFSGTTFQKPFFS